MSTTTAATTNHQDEAINLEEDMRKAKEDAAMLRSVILPLETEIQTLKSQLDDSNKRIKELENQVDGKHDGCVNDADDSTSSTNAASGDDVDHKLKNEFLNECLHLKSQLNDNFQKFINAEIRNVQLVNELFALLSDEQKFQVISSFNRQSYVNSIDEELNEEKFLESVNTVTVPQTIIDDMLVKFESLLKSATVKNPNEKSKRELKILYETEKKYREELEKNLNDKAIESNQQIEVLNRDMINLESIINELRGEYNNWQTRFQSQIDGLVKLNEDIRNETQEIERENETLKSENIRLKTENKQLFGERKIIAQELDKQFVLPESYDEVQQLVKDFREEIIHLQLSNRNYKQHIDHLNDKAKQLERANLQIQSANNIQDQLVISQSLESELERERKVRTEIENEYKIIKIQLKSVKEKSQTVIESLRKRNEQSEADIEKLKSENLELNNQIHVLKRDVKNNFSVQEDLVKLNQSLQIELEQTRASEKELRCQHEDDYTECSKCKRTFNQTRVKHRCKHCCKIYCAECCDKSIFSGPNKREFKVCDNCHMILDKDTHK